MTVHTKKGTRRSPATWDSVVSSRSSSDVSTAMKGYRDWIMSARSLNGGMAFRG